MNYITALIVMQRLSDEREHGRDNWLNMNIDKADRLEINGTNYRIMKLQGIGIRIVKS